MGQLRISGAAAEFSSAVSSTPSARGAGFGDALAQAVRGAEASQLEADRQSSALATGGGNLHETALALEKADVAMRLLVKTRNKLVEAYQEVMRMSV